MEKVESLVEKTTHKIIEYIKTNNIDPGEKIPNEYTLSEELNVGRSTFREAIRILVSRNILEVRQGSGTFVSDKLGQSSDPFGLEMAKDKHQMIEDLYDMRYILEPEVAALAALNATPEQVTGIEMLGKQIEASFLRGDDDHIGLDIKFHSMIAAASGNLAFSYILPLLTLPIQVQLI